MILHHVQLAIPPGSEDACRTFYCNILGWRELEKPKALAARGGLWLHTGNAEIHLGVEAGFHAAKKAHPAFLVDEIAVLAQKFLSHGCKIEWHDGIVEFKRFFVHDNVGNRLEFLQAV